MDANRVFIVKEGEFEVTKDWIVQSDKEEDVRTIQKEPKKASILSNKFYQKNSHKKIEKHTLAHLGPG